jgi:hypothetical protein
MPLQREFFFTFVPEPRQFADDKPECMRCVYLSTLKVPSLYLEARIWIRIQVMLIRNTSFDFLKSAYKTGYLGA